MGSFANVPISSHQRTGPFSWTFRRANSVSSASTRDSSGAPAMVAAPLPPTITPRPVSLQRPFAPARVPCWEIRERPIEVAQDVVTPHTSVANELGACVRRRRVRQCQRRLCVSLWRVGCCYLSTAASMPRQSPSRENVAVREGSDLPAAWRRGACPGAWLPALAHRGGRASVCQHRGAKAERMVVFSGGPDENCSLCAGRHAR